MAKFIIGKGDEIMRHLFGYHVDIPDEYGKPLSHTIAHSMIHIHCENGLYIVRQEPRDPRIMKYRGIKFKKIMHHRWGGEYRPEDC